MIASEVPMQSCMRTSSGTPMTRNTSYNTGTMIAPPPIPNRPARMPTRMPAPAIQPASSAISLGGYPNTTGSLQSAQRGAASGGHVRQIRRAVQHERHRFLQYSNAGARLHRLGREMAAEGARARHGAEKTEHVPRHRREADAARQFPFDIRHERLERLLGRRERRRFAEHQRIDRQEPPWLLVRGAAHHDAVEVADLRPRL